MDMSARGTCGGSEPTQDTHIESNGDRHSLPEQALPHAQPEFNKPHLGIPAEDVPKIQVEEVAAGLQHDVVQVPVADAQEVRDDAVARA